MCWSSHQSKNPMTTHKNTCINHKGFTHQKRCTLFWRSIIIYTYKFLLKWSPLPSSFSSPPHKISKSSTETIMIFFFFFVIEMAVWNSTGCFWGMGANARYLFPEIEKKTWLSSPSPQFLRPLINTNTNLVWSFNPSYHNNKRIINLTPMSSRLILLLLFYGIGDVHSEDDSGIWSGEKTPNIGLFW